MKLQVTKRIALGLLALSVWNCKTSDLEPIPYDSGVYILNAGNFSSNNGTISFLPRTGNTVATNIFQAANPSLGLSGGVQGYAEVNGKGLILVDNSTAGQDKVEIVEAGTFKSRATLKTPDIENPRQVIQAGPNKAYISCWDVSGDYSAGTFYKNPGYIAVVDLNTSTVIKKIPAVKGVEKMVVSGTEAFVGSNTYSGDKTLLVIDLNTDTEKQRIAFGSTPEPIALDANGQLWIQAGNDLVQIDPLTRLISKRLTFSAAPGSVTISADKRAFYYTLSGKTYRLPIESTIGPGSQVVARSFSALGVDPQTGRLYGSQSPALYTQAGYVLRYEPTGALIDSVKAEIAPSGFYFR
ncbi:YncE family protein [Spirosoma flavum]|uniref:YncE family protein n=1 Tax=Spirosoma flavum TaxID=2048557 RepID=A0ABW6AUH9_9BACT